MKKNLLPIFLCSLLYLVGCSTKEDPVKPEKEEAPAFVRQRPGSYVNSGARTGFSAGQKFTTANFFIKDIGVGPKAPYDRIWVVTDDGRFFYYSQKASASNFNPATGFWTEAYLTDSNGNRSYIGRPCNGVYPGIDVDHQGYPWFVDCSGLVWRTTADPYLNNALRLIDGRVSSAKDIACGANGSVYITRRPIGGGISGNGEIYKYISSTQWGLVPGLTGSYISADQLGRPWVAQDMGPLYYLDNGTWNLVHSGGWRDIGAANYAYPCALTAATKGANIYMYDYVLNVWSQPYGTGYEVRVDTDEEGYPYMVNPWGELWTH